AAEVVADLVPEADQEIGERVGVVEAVDADAGVHAGVPDTVELDVDVQAFLAAGQLDEVLVQLDALGVVDAVAGVAEGEGLGGHGSALSLAGLLAVTTLCAVTA